MRVVMSLLLFRKPRQGWNGPAAGGSEPEDAPWSDLVGSWLLFNFETGESCYCENDQFLIELASKFS